MIYLEDASNKQLITIALYEDCDIDLKFEACRELQIRKWQDYMLTDLVRLWGRGYEISFIAAELGVTENTVKTQLRKNNLYKKRVI